MTIISIIGMKIYQVNNISNSQDCFQTKFTQSISAHVVNQKAADIRRGCCPHLCGSWNQRLVGIHLPVRLFDFGASARCSYTFFQVSSPFGISDFLFCIRNVCNSYTEWRFDVFCSGFDSHGDIMYSSIIQRYHVPRRIILARASYRSGIRCCYAETSSSFTTRTAPGSNHTTAM